MFYAEFNSKFKGAQDRDSVTWSIYMNEEKFNIIAFYSSKPDPRVLSKKNIKLKKIPKNKYFKIIFQTIYIIFIKVDILIINKPNINLLIYLKLKKYIFFDKKKIAISFVNRLPYDRPLERMLYLPGFHQFAISKTIKEDFLNLTGQNIPVIHLVYDLELFKPNHAMNKNSIKIICVGSLQARKNPFLFVNIASQFKEHEFVWVGTGYYKGWIKEKVQKHSIKNFNLIDTLEQRDLAQLLGECSIFLFTSFHEGFPNVIVEALSAGLPVITFDTYGPEAIENGYNGFIAKDEFEMKEKLKIMLEDQQLLEEMSQNALKSSKQFYGKNKIYELENFLLEIGKK